MQEMESAIRARRIAGTCSGFFAGKSWRTSPEPFLLGKELAARLERLGGELAAFQRACAQLYRMSVDGRQPAWIAELLDRGKPPALVALQREKRLAAQLPRIIRPDVILTEEGFVIAELDSVPGGIGLTAWLNRVYSEDFSSVIGGASGMLDGFAAIMPAGEIVVSREAETYRPEMEWLASALNERCCESSRWRVVDTRAGQQWSKNVYRFFELFDLENVECAGELMDASMRGDVDVTPPFKPALEEKLWFALFWLRPLASYWMRMLGERVVRSLQEMIPYTWLVNPEPLPVHAALPRLEVHSWQEVATFSQKQRDLIVKISGFSEKAWGSRGVTLGSDVSSEVWREVIEEAQRSWQHSPYILQVYHHPRRVSQTYLADDGTVATMRGRVRLCPYYFLIDERSVALGGILATICPEDKKIVHGMSDAILAPTRV